jgi:thiol-disulfide isomerase/thioredoxin
MRNVGFLATVRIEREHATVPPMEAKSIDLAGLEATLRSLGKPAVVHHFATWCDPCEDELPILAEELEKFGALGVTSVAVAWDLFMNKVPPEQALAACRKFLDRAGAAFDRLYVYTGAPEDLFKSQAIHKKTVPFSDVRDKNGAVVAAFDEPIFDELVRQTFLKAVRKAAGAPA